MENKINFVKALINGAGSRFFRVSFIKSDGSLRVMQARTGVKKYLKGDNANRVPNTPKANQVVVYDVKAKGYRIVTTDKVVSFKCGNTVWESQ